MIESYRASSILMRMTSTMSPSDTDRDRAGYTAPHAHYRLGKSLSPLAKLAPGRNADRRFDRDFELPGDPPLSGVAERLVVGRGLLQPVVLVIDAR